MSLYITENIQVLQDEFFRRFPGFAANIFYNREKQTSFSRNHFEAICKEKASDYTD